MPKAQSLQITQQSNIPNHLPQATSNAHRQSRGDRVHWGWCKFLSPDAKSNTIISAIATGPQAVKRGEKASDR
jgi:hypothetical protein